MGIHYHRHSSSSKHLWIRFKPWLSPIRFTSKSTAAKGAKLALEFHARTCLATRANSTSRRRHHRLNADRLPEFYTETLLCNPRQFWISCKVLGDRIGCSPQIRVGGWDFKWVSHNHLPTAPIGLDQGDWLWNSAKDAELWIPLSGTSKMQK